MSLTFPSRHHPPWFCSSWLGKTEVSSDCSLQTQDFPMDFSMDFPWFPLIFPMDFANDWFIPMDFHTSMGSPWISHGFSHFFSVKDEARTILQHLSEAWRCWKANIPWKAPGASEEVNKSIVHRNLPRKDVWSWKKLVNSDFWKMFDNEFELM